MQFIFKGEIRMASVVCMECKTVFSEYSDKCVKCGCPTDYLKTKKENILKELKERDSSKVTYLKECLNHNKEKLNILRKKENDVIGNIEQLLKVEEEELEKALENTENEIVYYKKQLEKYNEDIQKRLNTEIKVREGIDEKIKKCSVFKFKEKELLKDELEKQRGVIRNILDEINSKREENRIKEIISKLYLKKEELSENYFCKEDIFFQNGLAELVRDVEIIFAEYNWAHEFKNKHWENVIEQTSVVNAVEKLLTEGVTYYSYGFPAEVVEEEVCLIISKLAAATKEEILTSSLFLSHMEPEKREIVFWKLKKNHSIAIIENNLDDTEYYYVLSNTEKMHLTEAENERMTLSQKKLERERQIHDEINKLTKAALESSKRSKKDSSITSIELQYIKNLTQKVEELADELKKIEQDDFSSSIKTIDVNKELDLATMQVALELSNAKPKPKDASVIGRAVAGAAVAGPVGAVVGAVSAVDKNIRNKE